MSHTHTLTDAVVEYFRAHPGEWISMQTLASVAGTGGWRTRVSEARTVHGLRIENRTGRIKLANGQKITTSHYRFTPPLDVLQAQALQFETDGLGG